MYWLSTQNEEEGLAAVRGTWKRDQSILIRCLSLILDFHSIAEWRKNFFPLYELYSKQLFITAGFTLSPSALLGHDGDTAWWTGFDVVQVTWGGGLISHSFTCLSGGLFPYLSTSLSFTKCKRKGFSLDLKEWFLAWKLCAASLY